MSTVKNYIALVDVQLNNFVWIGIYLRNDISSMLNIGSLWYIKHVKHWIIMLYISKTSKYVFSAFIHYISMLWDWLVYAYSILYAYFILFNFDHNVSSAVIHNVQLTKKPIGLFIV